MRPVQNVRQEQSSFGNEKGESFTVDETCCGLAVPETADIQPHYGHATKSLSPFSTRRDNKGKRVALHFLKKHIIGSCQFGSFWRQSLYGFQPPHRAYWRALLSLFFHIRRSHWAWHAFWIGRRKGAVIICGTLETLRLRTSTMESTST